MTSPFKGPLSAGWATIAIMAISLLVSGSISWGVTSTKSRLTASATRIHVVDKSVHVNAELIAFRLQSIDERLERIEALLANPPSP